MPYLNWSTQTRDLKLEAHSSFKNKIHLQMKLNEARELSRALDEVFNQSEGELRLKLSEEWVLFIKCRETESRTLLAHPDAVIWVATLALEVELGKQLFFALQKLEVGQSLILSELGALAKMSNLEVVITVFK